MFVWWNLGGCLVEVIGCFETTIVWVMCLCDVLISGGLWDHGDEDELERVVGDVNLSGRHFEADEGALRAKLSNRNEPNN